MQSLWVDAGIKRNFTTYEDAMKFGDEITKEITYSFPQLV